MIPQNVKPEKPDDIIHRAIGLYRLKEFPYDFEFSSDVDVRVEFEDDDGEYITDVEYHKGLGMVSVRHGYIAEMEKSGASITWVQEHAIKKSVKITVCWHIYSET